MSSLSLDGSTRDTHLPRSLHSFRNFATIGINALSRSSAEGADNGAALGTGEASVPFAALVFDGRFIRSPTFSRATVRAAGTTDNDVITDASATPFLGLGGEFPSTTHQRKRVVAFRDDPRAAEA
jgi:hypothetical protein